MNNIAGQLEVTHLPHNAFISPTCNPAVGCEMSVTIWAAGHIE